MAKSTRAQRVSEFGKGKLISHTKVTNGKHEALRKAQAEGHGKMTANGGWRGNNSQGGKFISGFGGRDNS